MKRLNKFLDEHSYSTSTILIILALAIDIAVFVGSVVAEGFGAFSFSMLVIEVILHGFLIYALLVKHEKMLNLFMLMVKVFDVIFYISIVTRKIDKTLNKEMFSYLNFSAYAISAVLLIIILVFFCLNFLTGKHKYWVVVKVSMLLTAAIMLICSIFEIVNMVQNSKHWFLFLEPLYMVFLMTGMFVICHYIEKER